jgi:CMP-N-acetylneuraminic acid synthetase
MYKDKKILAIIPARGGSKRLPKKNLMDLAGKPLIAYSIEAAKNSQYIDDVILSSESEEILSVAREYGAQTPFVRPKELAEDTSRSIDVVTHALKTLTQKYDAVILLQPTSPLRTTEDIDGAIEMFYNKQATSVIGVCEMEHSPLWANTLDESMSMEGFLDDKYNNARSQDLPVYYRINGAFYMSKTQSVLENETFFVKKNIYAYLMSQEDSVDIDTKLDFIVASAILKEREECQHTM